MGREGLRLASATICARLAARAGIPPIGGTKTGFAGTVPLTSASVTLLTVVFAAALCPAGAALAQYARPADALAAAGGSRAYPSVMVAAVSAAGESAPWHRLARSPSDRRMASRQLIAPAVAGAHGFNRPPQGYRDYAARARPVNTDIATAGRPPAPYAAEIPRYSRYRSDAMANGMPHQQAQPVVQAEDDYSQAIPDKPPSGMPSSDETRWALRVSR